MFGNRLSDDERATIERWRVKERLPLKQIRARCIAEGWFQPPSLSTLSILLQHMSLSDSELMQYDTARGMQTNLLRWGGRPKASSRNQRRKAAGTGTGDPSLQPVILIQAPTTAWKQVALRSVYLGRADHAQPMPFARWQTEYGLEERVRYPAVALWCGYVGKVPEVLVPELTHGFIRAHDEGYAIFWGASDDEAFVDRVETPQFADAVATWLNGAVLPNRRNDQVVAWLMEAVRVDAPRQYNKGADPGEYSAFTSWWSTAGSRHAAVCPPAPRPVWWLGEGVISAERPV